MSEGSPALTSSPSDPVPTDRQNDQHDDDQHQEVLRHVEGATAEEQEQEKKQQYQSHSVSLLGDPRRYSCEARAVEPSPAALWRIQRLLPLLAIARCQHQQPGVGRHLSRIHRAADLISRLETQTGAPLNWEDGVVMSPSTRKEKHLLDAIIAQPRPA